MEKDCVFCRIIRGEIPSQPLYGDEQVVVVRDIHPRAPVHLLLLPIRHFTTPGVESEAAMGRLMAVAGQMAAREGVAEKGYRLVVNQGPDGGQEIAHLHLHLLGGRRLGAMG
jgi:histidine triad (HIT) family protein